MRNNDVKGSYTIVPLTAQYVREHIDRLKEIAADIPKENWATENYLYDLPGKWEYSIAAIDPETAQMAGFIIASAKESAIHIHKYAVHADQRSKGLGAYLFANFESRVRQSAATSQITLFVDEHNEGAKKFYKGLGFEVLEHVPGMTFYRKRLQVIVGIHQPNFVPWMGFFHKIAQSDRFVILDHVVNRPNDAIYTKRVTTVCNNQEYWLTIPISKVKGVEFVPINEMVITKDGFEKKHLRTIEMNYKKTPFYKEYFYLFEHFYQHPSPLIAERNIDLIKQICGVLQISTPLYLSSNYQLTTSSNELLIDLIQKVNGNTYLHGQYAVSDKGYQDNELFAKQSIELVPQNFKHPHYTQHNNSGAFITGVSIIDALMNIGAEATEDLIKEYSK